MGSDSFFNGDIESSWKILQVHLYISLFLPLVLSCPVPCSSVLTKALGEIVVATTEQISSLSLPWLS
jgi:hypothetical protein